MLDLKSPRWHDLSHAYGSASDIPMKLEQLRSAPPAESCRTEPWLSLWSSLCHQTDVSTASYAAVPHIIAIAETKPLAHTLDHLLLSSAIENYRHKKSAPVIPADLQEPYFVALKRGEVLASRLLSLPLDEVGVRIVLGALASFRGFPKLSDRILEPAEDETPDFWR